MFNELRNVHGMRLRINGRVNADDMHLRIDGRVNADVMHLTLIILSV